MTQNVAMGIRHLGTCTGGPPLSTLPVVMTSAVTVEAYNNRWPGGATTLLTSLRNNYTAVSDRYLEYQFSSLSSFLWKAKVDKKSID